METKTPKTFFNYRVVLDKDSNGHPFYSIRGVHYSKYGEQIDGWDAEPITLTFDQGDSMSEYLEVLQKATTKPVFLVKGDTLEIMGERPAEMFVGHWGEYPKVVTEV